MGRAEEQEGAHTGGVVRSSQMSSGGQRERGAAPGSGRREEDGAHSEAPGE